jgi:pimeloyl-ACP methyl ester carboxylesterase
MEILSGVDFLHTACNISTQGIAVIGADLGGWAAVLAAGLSSRIEALVLLTPPVVSTAHQEVDRLGRRLRVGGFISAEIDLAQAVLCERIRRLSVGEGSDAIYASEAACRPAPWYPWLPGTTPNDIEAFATVLNYDPWTLIRPVHCSILAVLGEDDPATPAHEGAERLRRILHTPEHHDRHIAVLPRTDNGLRPVWAVDGNGPSSPGDWNPETVNTITNWVTPRIGHRRTQYTTPY